MNSSQFTLANHREFTVYYSEIFLQVEKMKEEEKCYKCNDLFLTEQEGSGWRGYHLWEWEIYFTRVIVAEPSWLLVPVSDLFTKSECV